MFLNNTNKKESRKFFNDIIDIGIAFKMNEKIHKKDLDVNDGKKMIEKMPLEGKNIKTILQEFRNNILPYCTNF